MLATTLLLLAAGLVTLAVQRHEQQGDLQRNENALQMVTSSDAVVVRLVAAQGTPEDTHGTYRTRPGADIAVLTLSHVGPPPAGQVYQGWAREDGIWRSLGVMEIGSDGHALVIVDRHGADAPQALELTLEPTGGSAQPRGPVVISWSGP